MDNMAETTDNQECVASAPAAVFIACWGGEEGPITLESENLILYMHPTDWHKLTSSWLKTFARDIRS